MYSGRSLIPLVETIANSRLPGRDVVVRVRRLERLSPKKRRGRERGPPFFLVSLSNQGWVVVPQVGITPLSLKRSMDSFHCV